MIRFPAWGAGSAVARSRLKACPLLAHREDTMSHYALDELIAKWGSEQMTAEQMIGQMLQHLRAQEKRLRELERGLTLVQDEEPEMVTLEPNYRLKFGF